MMLFGLHNECPSLDCKSFLEKNSRKVSDAIPQRLDLQWNGLRAQQKKKEEWALEITKEKKPTLRDDVPHPPGL